MSDPRTRQIKIKAGVVKRLVREEASYVTEAEQQRQKIERLKAEAADEEDLCNVNKQMEVLEECHMMIPDCRRRLAAAHADLLRTLEETEEDLGASEDFIQARGLLDSVKMEEFHQTRSSLDPLNMDEFHQMSSPLDSVKMDEFHQTRSSLDPVKMDVD